MEKMKVIDADRPFLEQFEEAAQFDEDVMEWLEKEIYGQPERLALFCSPWLTAPGKETGVGSKKRPIPATDQIWRYVIPSNYWPKLDGAKVVKAGFGAGPACMAQHNEEFSPPISLDQGLIWLERWRNTFKRARLVLNDGAVVHFDPHGFTSYMPKGGA